MKKNIEASPENRSGGSIAKLENKLRRAEAKLAKAEAKLVKRREKLAGLQEEYEAAVAARDDAGRQPAAACSAENNGDEESED